MAEGLLTYFKEQFGVGKTPAGRALELSRYVNEIEAELRFDWTRRVYGDGTYSGYNTLRDFYKGKQWSFRKEGGGTMRTYNYCFTIVENMTAFLTNEPPQMSCPPKRLDDAMERALAEARTKILSAIHDDNSLSLVFQRAARTGSITGDAYIFGAIPTFKTNDEGVKTFDRIRYWNIERPETIQPIWKDDNYAELGGFIKRYRVSVATCKRMFAAEIKEFGITVQEDFDVEQPGQTTQTASNVPMMTIKEYWDDREYVLMFGTTNRPVHYIKHDWGFVPLHNIPNIHLPGEPRGTSDLEHELDAQQEYNERASDLADIIKEIAKPAYWGKNIDNLTEVRSGQIVIYSVGDDGEILAMPKSGQTAPVQEYLQDRKNDIIGLSGMNQVLYPGNQVLQSTGRALSVIMQGVNNKIANRKDWWVKAFKDLNKTILFHAQNHIPGADKIIDDYFKTDVFVSSVLLRSVADEINKFQAKVQSLTTTQHNVGIPNPSEEQKLMKEELQDEILATEISKQPGLLHQIIAERMARAQAANGGYAGEGGAPPAGGGGSPIATPSDNAPGENPAPAPGIASPVGSRGKVAQAAQRGGGAPAIKK